MITHDEKIAAHGSRVVKILDGELFEERNRMKLLPIMSESAEDLLNIPNNPPTTDQMQED